MKVLVIEERKWSSREETAEALKNNTQIQIGFHDFDLLIPGIATLEPDILVIDACFGPDRQTSTAPLITEVRKIFKGKIIAISNTAPSRIILKVAGCQYECAKGRLAKLLIRLSQQSPEDRTKKNLSAVA